MKLSDMRNLKAEDFQKEIDDRKKALMEMRFQGALPSGIAQPHLVSKLRREIAQLNTIRREQLVASLKAGAQ